MSADLQSTRWRVLTLLGFAELLGMSLWFSASATFQRLGTPRCDRKRVGSGSAWLRFGSGNALFDRVLPRRRLSSGDEDDRNLVPGRARLGNRGHRRSLDCRQGHTLPGASNTTRWHSAGGPDLERWRSHRRCSGGDRLSRWSLSVWIAPILLASGARCRARPRMATCNIELSRSHVRALRVLDLDSFVSGGERRGWRKNSRATIDLVARVHDNSYWRHRIGMGRIIRRQARA